MPGQCPDPGVVPASLGVWSHQQCLGASPSLMQPLRLWSESGAEGMLTGTRRLEMSPTGLCHRLLPSWLCCAVGPCNCLQAQACSCVGLYDALGVYFIRVEK